MISGFGLPSFVFLIGDIVDSFDLTSYTPKDVLDSIGKVSWIMTVIGLGVWLVTFIWFTLLLITSERIIQKTKAAYFKSILDQECEWFDEGKPAQLSSMLNQECLAIQKAIGERLGLVFMTMAVSVSGIFFSFLKGWLFSFALLCYFPLLSSALFFASIIMQKGFVGNIKAYSQSAGYAE